MSRVLSRMQVCVTRIKSGLSNELGLLSVGRSERLRELLYCACYFDAGAISTLPEMKRGTRETELVLVKRIVAGPIVVVSI